MAENKRLLEPLNKAREENAEMKRQMTNYEKDKTVLKVRIASTNGVFVYSVLYGTFSG